MQRKKKTKAKWSTKMLEEVVNKRGYKDTEEMTQWRNIRRVLMCCGWISGAKWVEDLLDQNKAENKERCLQGAW